jgi:THO complex subunit 2
MSLRIYIHVITICLIIFLSFRLYGSWKGESLLLSHPSLLRKRVDVVKKIKHLMRRISKENVKPMGRQLGKLAHSMPAVIFDYVSSQFSFAELVAHCNHRVKFSLCISFSLQILSQIQLFDNLISPVIDALKFMTALSYDVLGYCLLEALSPATGNSSSGSMSVVSSLHR